MPRLHGARLTDSIFVRVLILVALVSVVITGALTANAIRAAASLSTDVITELGAEVTGLIAEQSGGALKFRKSEELHAALAASIERLNGKAAGAMAVMLDGTVLASEIIDGADEARMLALAAQVIETGEELTDTQALAFAVPSQFGAEKSTVGVVVLQWDATSLAAELAGQRQRSLVFGGIVLTLLMGVLGFALRRMIAVPLQRIAAAMGSVADGNYDTEIPAFRRGNEVGIVARALASFRDQLKAGEEDARIAAFKGAAFENCSAALMIADADFTIAYTNPAFGRLAIEHGDAVKRRLPQFDPDTLIGTSIDVFHKDPGAIRRKLSALRDAHRAELEFGNHILGLNISPIDGEDGQRTGYVVEWKNVSEEQRNAAVLETFEKRQAVAEFDRNGRLLSANGIVASLAGRSVGELAGSALSGLVREAAGTPVSEVSDAVFGEFQVVSPAGGVGHLVGGLTPIRNRAGDITKIILIGTDVSAQRRQIEAAGQRQAQMQAEQDRMIEALRGGLEMLSDGDLTVRLDAPFSEEHDRLRHDFNRALARLSEVIAAVSLRSGDIRGDVGDISSAANDLSKRTEHQAATLEQTAAALAELTASVNSAAEGARRANDVVSQAKSSAEKSGGVVRDAVAAMGLIAESSTKISSIISVIDDIAFQTNLLALNAGVEAARAGDAGRGFAVVASEVRALAQRSSEAAREISALISASGEHVSRGVTLVGDAGTALEQIAASVADISDHVASISASAQEQSGGLTEINEAMGQLDQVTQQNAAMFEETTAASQTLAAAAEELAQAVSLFRIVREDRPGSVAPAVAAAATGTRGRRASPTAEQTLDGAWEEF